MNDEQIDTAANDDLIPEEHDERRGVSWKPTLLLCVVILCAAAGVVWVIFSTEPTAKRGGAIRESAMLVDVVRAERGTYRPAITVMGRVEPAKEIVLSPRVRGEVVRVAEALTPGGFVSAGELLLEIDPSDYETALRSRRSELHQARADLTLEMGRQKVAESDYQLLETRLPSEQEALVLRQPQLETARARVEAAEAAVRQAELDLERTTIVAPFAAHILTRDVNVGSQLAPGDTVARLIGLDELWVIASVPRAKLRWISVPGLAPAEGSRAHVRDRAAWPDGVSRVGQVDALIGELADQTRMARVIVSVPDPFLHDATGHDAVGNAPVLMVGAFVEVEIEGTPVDDVVRLSRDHVRTGDTVWVMDGDDRLSIRDAEIVVRDARFVYIASGVEDGERVVTTNLATVVDGARLRLEGGDGSGAADGVESSGPGGTGS